MATRVNRKNAPTTSPKEVVITEKAKNDQTEPVPKASGVGRPIGKRLAKKQTKKIVKKSIGIKLKAKVQKLKLNPLAKSVLQNTPKKSLLKNGVKEVKPRKKRMQVKKDTEIKKDILEDAPPVLEPIFPFEENLLGKKPKKRGPKKNVKQEIPDLIDSTKIKKENEEESDFTDNSFTDIPNLPRQVKKRGVKKPKLENDTLEDVMNDLSYLIKSEDIKKEADNLSESGKSDTATKPKKLTKRQKIELLKKKIIKKENIENTLSKLDSADEKIIDMLDLNVNMLKKKSPVPKRRHSIEKCPIGSSEPVSDLNVFSHLPRSISPRARRKGKVDSGSRRSSPYSTRSDSPARILRNGKQRKLKDGLFEGLDLEVRKRRRLCSDSGSKLSGYESDGSFSDLASSHGSEATKEDEKDIKPSISTASNGPIDSLALDTNSNIYTPDVPEESLPEKDVLLDIMKQTFNNEVDFKKSPTKFKVGSVATSRFYTSRRTTPGIIQGKAETILKEEIKEKIADEAPVMENEAELNLSSAVPEVTAKLEEDSAKPEEDSAKPEEDSAKPEEDSAKPEPEAPSPEKIVDSLPVLEENLEVTKDSPVLEEKENLTENLAETPPVLTEFVENLVEPPTVADPSPPELTAEVIEKIEEPIPMECEDIKDKPIIEQPPTLEENFVEAEATEPLEFVPIDSIPNFRIVSVETVEEEVVEDAVPTPADIINDSDRTINQDSVDNVIAESQTVPMEEEPSLTENTNAVIEPTEEDLNFNVVESEEMLAEKESILKALGLQRSKMVEETKQKTKEKPPGCLGESYTGTLKTVIKINRDKKKGHRSSIKAVQKSKSKNVAASVEEEPVGVEEPKEKASKEKEATSPSSKHGTQSSDAGAHRKSHYSNRSNMDGSSEHTSDGESAPQDGAIKALVIPEKASSFSIHPGRLCKDECSYCFGKFGLFDTPCHIAQMKSVDRQNKILATEKHLTRDSCLCDACYRHVDRKANTPSYKSLKRNALVAPGPRQNHCHVLGCSKESSNILRRKWIIKMRKSICQVINLDLDNPGLHSIPICEDHYAALEHLMICAMCKRRLARNHIHYLGPETVDLNKALEDNGIPLTLSDKPVVCKLCKCFASIILKDPTERPETSNNFFVEYKKRLLHFNDIVPMDESAAEEPIAVPSKADRADFYKKKKKSSKDLEAPGSPTEEEGPDEEPERRTERIPSTDTSSQPQSRSESPSDDYNGIDYNTLIPAIAMDVGSDSESKKEVSKTPVMFKKFTEMQKEGVEIVKVTKADNKPKPETIVKKYGYGPSVSVRQLFPGEEDLPLAGSIDFNNVKEKTPEGWEKCKTLIQYDEETKRLWQELQKPYGNQSSFLRHLILLEKYFRNGDLVLSPRASHHSINYSESVHNRLRAYDNIPSSAGNIQPLSMLPFNKVQSKSSSGIITSCNIPSVMTNPISTHALSSAAFLTTNSRPVGTLAMSVTTVPTNTNLPKSTPLTISQLNSPPLLPSTSVLQPIRPKMVGQPPGLISLHPGTARPIAPLVKVPQPQKIKFPITKNWRPNLIPIDPTKKQERKTGLVQVISGGKPYHITLEDYKKMCAIKRSFEMKQKRLQEAQAAKPVQLAHNSVLKSIIPRKGLVISSKTATITAPTIKPEPNTTPPSHQEGLSDGENILDKLDKQVEKLESKLNEKSLLLPRIPRSLTVIPQTVTKKPERPSSPVLSITSKNSSGGSGTGKS